MPWTSGLLDCCRAPGGWSLCAVTTFCPCVTFGQIVDEAKPFPWMGAYVFLAALPSITVAGGAAPFASLGCLPVALLAAYASNTVRENDKIEGQLCCDVTKGFFCECCTLIQARNEQLSKALAQKKDGDDTQLSPPSLVGMRL